LPSYKLSKHCKNISTLISRKPGSGWMPFARQGVDQAISVVIHFDTNFLIQAAVPGTQAHQQFRAWASSGETVSVSTIAWSEFLCGPLDPKAESLARQIFP